MACSEYRIPCSLCVEYYRTHLGEKRTDEFRCSTFNVQRPSGLARLAAKRVFMPHFSLHCTYCQTYSFPPCFMRDKQPGLCRCVQSRPEDGERRRLNIPNWTDRVPDLARPQVKSSNGLSERAPRFITKPFNGPSEIDPRRGVCSLYCPLDGSKLGNVLRSGGQVSQSPQMYIQLRNADLRHHLQ